MLPSVSTSKPVYIKGETACVCVVLSDVDTGTITVTVTDRAGKATTATVELPVATTTVGWSPGGGTVADIAAHKAVYGDPKAIRLFSPPGKGIQPWTGPLFNAVPRDAVLIYSVKDWPLDIAAWLSSRPTDWRTPFYFCVDHEPEQGPAKGDPDPATYRRQWRELISQLQGHPRRNEIRLVPIFTEYYAKRHQDTFWNDFGVVASYDGVDAVGYDIYDGESTLALPYRSPTERNAVALAHARRVGKPLVIAEWGIERRTADANGAACVLAMRENLAYLRRQPDVPIVSWWHSGGDSLFNRLPEQQALKALLAGA